MKKTILTFFGVFALALAGFAQTYEYKILTSVESIIPSGLGRSRLLEAQTQLNPEDFTTKRRSGTDSDQARVRRRDIKIDELDETKMLNFYSLVGINFQNIASNDALLSARLTDLSAEGWELAFVVSGVESDAGGEDGNGIYITRYIFKRPLSDDYYPQDSE